MKGPLHPTVRGRVPTRPETDTTPSAPRDAIDRGFNFAERLHELVAETGPDDLSSAEQSALGSHLVSAAIQWVQARNRATAVKP